MSHRPHRTGPNRGADAGSPRRSVPRGAAAATATVTAAGGPPAGGREHQLAAAPGGTGELWLSVKRHGLLRSVAGGHTRARADDDAHRRGRTGRTVTGDPRRHGRVHPGTNGRGVRYGGPAR